MPKSLKELFEVYRPKAKDEQDFVDKHVTIKHADRNGNGDDVFKGNTKKADRKKERHGYEPGEDEKVYEDVEDLEELSRATIGRYSQKAKSIADNEGGKDRTKGRELAGRKKWGGTMSGVKPARVMATEEVELDEMKKVPTHKLKALVARGESDEGGMSPAFGMQIKAARNELARRKKAGIREEVEQLEEGVMRLSKVHIVHHHDHPAAKEFAKNYTAGMKGDHREGGPTAADEKAANKFYERYHGVRTREGFAGSGTYVYHDRKTGAKWKVDKHPNGKTFYGTDHIISHHTGDIHENVDQDYYFTDDEDKVIRSLAGAAEELGEELDLETLAGIAEEVLSELSVDTLKSYRTKARADAYDADAVDDERRFRKRAAGSNLSGKKIIKKGGSLKTEEVEDLDEISKATMGRYINKAKDQIDAASWRSGYNAAKPNDPKSGKVIAAKERQLSKRHGGIELAVKKLTKEDIINKAIETYIPEGVELPSLQERLVDKLDEHNLSEAHIHILLSMFDSLNEQNQQRMLDRVNTLEDVNSLLDFAISNRGE